MFVLVLIGAVLVVTVTALSRRVGVAAPLLLVLVGVAVSFIPGVREFVIDPEIILAGVLPTLLYAAAVELPTMDFRRDFAAISALSVGLVVLTAIVVGVVAYHLIPDMTIPTAIALGAVLSPTDAVATKIIKELGAPPRVVTVLEGEGLLNDATALVLLRSAVAASIVAVNATSVILDFAWAVVFAVICGLVVGRLSLLARKAISNPAITTAISFLIPFAAFFPAEHFGASGLVAVVVAGLVTGHNSGRYLSPQDRFFEHINWRTVEILLEGGVFFLMGVQVHTLLTDVHQAHDRLSLAIGMGLLMILVVLAVRAAYVVPLLLQVGSVARRRAARLPELEYAANKLDRRLASNQGQYLNFQGPFLVPRHKVQALRWRIARRVADTGYLLAKPLGQAEGGLLVFAGMRGAVTLAAAQSLPFNFPHRSLVILLAFVAAAGSLLLQGGTLRWVTRALGLTGKDDNTLEAHEIHHFIEDAASQFLADPNLRRRDGSPYHPAVVARVKSQVVHPYHAGEFDSPDNHLDVMQQVASFRELYLRTIEEQREALLRVHELGGSDAHALEDALSALDAEQISLEMKPGEWLHQ
jgi:CPA1 family monovalent cation:H+ antiporter